MTGDLLSPALISKRRRAIYELVLSPEMEIHRQLWAAARAWSDPRRLRPWRSHAVCPYKSPGVPQRRNCDRRRCWHGDGCRPWRGICAGSRLSAASPGGEPDCLMDTHVHAAPDVFGRSLDDEEVAILYKDRGLEALVLKNHVLPTADRAWFARKHVAGLKVFGGVVLNSPAGGINPDAVNWMWRMQGGYGRVVWFPTFDADNHVKHFKDAPEAIKVLGADGKVLPAVREVLKICAEQKLVVHTGHLSPSEALAVIAAVRDAGVEVVVVTYALM